MPNASELDKFVTVNVDIKDDDIVKIMNAGEIVTFETEGKPSRSRLRISIKCAEGQVKDITLNETSRKALMVEYGKMTEDWVGFSAKVDVVKQNVGGEMKNIAYLSPVKGSEKEIDVGGGTESLKNTEDLPVNKEDEIPF